MLKNSSNKTSQKKIKVIKDIFIGVKEISLLEEMVKQI